MPDYFRTHFFRAEPSANGCDSNRNLHTGATPAIIIAVVGFTCFYTSNTVALRDEELVLTVVAWLSFSFFLFSDCSGLVFFTRGVLSSRYDVLGLVFLEYADKAFAEVPDFIEYPTPVQVLIEFVFWALLMFAMAPGLSGGRGEMAMAVASPARLVLFLRSAPHAVPLVPVQLQSMELSATTVGEWWRHHSL